MHTCIIEEQKGDKTYRKQSEEIYWKSITQSSGILPEPSWGWGQQREHYKKQTNKQTWSLFTKEVRKRVNELIFIGNLLHSSTL